MENSGVPEVPTLVPDGTVVIPGDEVLRLDSVSVPMKLTTGPGLFQEGNSILASKAGVLHHSQPRWSGAETEQITLRMWVNNTQRRYMPAEGEAVIGIVTGRRGEDWVLDINSSQSALLDQLAFQGATKRNKPQLKNGDLIFCRLVNCPKDIPPEVSCLGPKGKSQGYGVLNGGTLARLSIGHCRRLLVQNSDAAHVLQALGQKVAFETAIGRNGRVWISGESAPATIAVVNSIKVSEYLNKKQSELLVQEVLDSITKVIAQPNVSA
eukprot:Clim_evm104s128 gene=Clim_evmTU104s128